MDLCEQSRNRANPEKLAALIKEIDRILGEEQKRLDESRKGPNGRS